MLEEHLETQVRKPCSWAGDTTLLLYGIPFCYPFQELLKPDWTIGRLRVHRDTNKLLSDLMDDKRDWNSSLSYSKENLVNPWNVHLKGHLLRPWILKLNSQFHIGILLTLPLPTLYKGLWDPWVGSWCGKPVSSHSFSWLKAWTSM